MSKLDAILLAGGKSSRMQGPDKVMLQLAGRPLLERAIEAAHSAGCAHIAVVGPERDLSLSADIAYTLVREDPPFAGPVAGLAAAEPLGESEWVLLLATDLPKIAEVIALLTAAIEARPEVDAHIIEAADGYLEWLCSAMKRTVFEQRLAAHPHLSVGVKRLFDGIETVSHRDPGELTADVDTPEQWAAAQERPIQDAG